MVWKQSLIDREREEKGSDVIRKVSCYVYVDDDDDIVVVVGGGLDISEGVRGRPLSVTYYKYLTDDREEGRCTKVSASSHIWNRSYL